MTNREVAVAERPVNHLPTELVLPQDPVLRNLAIQKLNGQNVVYVPILVTDVTPDAIERVPAVRTEQEGLFARLLRFLNEARATQQVSRETRGWGD